MNLFVVDTNVMVAAFLSRDRLAPPRRLVARMLEARVRYAISMKLLAECRAVLLRPKIVARHGLSVQQVDEVLTAIVVNAVVLSPPPASIGPPDPSDQMLVDLLVALPGSTMITGDEPLLQSVLALGHLAWTPREWVEADEAKQR